MRMNRESSTPHTIWGWFEDGNSDGRSAAFGDCRLHRFSQPAHSELAHFTRIRSGVGIEHGRHRSARVEDFSAWRGFGFAAFAAVCVAAKPGRGGLEIGGSLGSVRGSRRVVGPADGIGIRGWNHGARARNL